MKGGRKLIAMELKKTHHKIGLDGFGRGMMKVYQGSHSDVKLSNGVIDRFVSLKILVNPSTDLKLCI
jgi:hypothetical protein